MVIKGECTRSMHALERSNKQRSEDNDKRSVGGVREGNIWMRSCWPQNLAYFLGDYSCRKCTYLAKSQQEFIVFVEKRVTEICTETAPVIATYKPFVLPMDNIHIPEHEVHLKAVKDRAISIIAEDELDGLAISNPRKMHSSTVMVIFIISPLTSKTLTKGRE